MAKTAEDTPMLRHYFEVKAQHPEALLLYRVGDFYEMYSDDAITAVRVLGLSFFDFLDTLCSDWLLPLGGLAFTLFVGWWMSKADVRDELTNGGTCNVKIFKVVYFLMRYLAPVGIVLVFLSNILL